MSKIFETLAGSLWDVMKDIATSKTNRYVLSDLEKEVKKEDGMREETPELVKQIVGTFCVVMTKRAKSSMITADGEMYPVSDYQFPIAWWILAKARRVYATKGSIEYAKPYWVADEYDGKTISPAKIIRFFEQFNAGQSEGSRIELAGVPDDFNDDAYLGQFKALCCRDCLATWAEDGGVFDDVVAQILGIECPVDDQFLKVVDSYEERSVSKWLMSVK